jgi:hypothetical protein
MSEEAKGTLKDDVTSINEQEKNNLIKFTVAAADEITKKKGKPGKTRKTKVELTKENGITYQILATYEGAPPPGSNVEAKIKSIGLNDKLTNNLVGQYINGKITLNHVRDIIRINTIDDIVKLDPNSQKRLIETIIQNRNEQNDNNSAEASIVLIKSGNESKYIVDTWYRGILRLIQKLSQSMDIDDETTKQLSNNQKHQLINKISQLISKLQHLIQILEKQVENNNKTL